MVEPEITEKTRYHTRGLDGMCLYPPWTFPWTDQSSIIDLLKHALIWLIKWDVFDRSGKWIGSETPHTFRLPTGKCPSLGFMYVLLRL